MLSEFEKLKEKICKIGSDKITKEEFYKLLELIEEETGRDATNCYLRLICIILMDMFKKPK